MRSGGLDREAHQRATILLLSMLSPAQRADYKQTGHFDVLKGKWRYRIGETLQVRVYPRDAPSRRAYTESWCVYIPNCPRGDSIIAQLLMLRSDPSELRKAAEVSPGMLRVTGVPWETPDPRRRAEILANVRRMLQRSGYAVPEC